MPDDDSPTMSGIPEERGQRGAQDALEDSTAAQSEPPAHRPSRPEGSPEPADVDVDAPQPHGADEEDRTVQQKVEPKIARKPPPPPAAGRPPSIPVTSKPVAPPPSAPMVSAVASTEPAPKALGSSAATKLSMPALTAIEARAAVESRIDSRSRGSVTAADEIIADDLTDEATEDLDDDDPIEDSITATAPRVDSGRLGLTIPGSVEIRTAEPDDMMDETEVRTRPGHIPLNIPPALRAQLDRPQGSQPPPPPRPAAGAPPSADDRERAAPTMMAAGVAAVAADSRENDENDDDGVTTQAAAPRVASVPDFGAPVLSPLAVISAKVPSTERSAASPAAKPSPVEDNDELLTRPGVEAGPEPETRPGVAAVDDPPTRPGLVDVATRPGIGTDAVPRLASDSYANEGDEDGDSITKRGMAPGFEDSVTASLPKPDSVIAAITARSASNEAGDGTIDDGTDGTTKRVKKPKLVDPSPADGESESITTQAPGPLTNMLRVIAADGPPAETPEGGIDPLIDDEPLENRTAVMVNAPLKRIIDDHMARSPLNPIRPTGPPIPTHHSALPLGPMGSAAPRLEPSSESGLRARTASMEQQGAERASMGMLGLANNDVRASGIARSAHHSENRQSLGPMEPLGGFTHPQPSVHDVNLGTSPSYGLLVAIVAGVSILVPAALFFMLNRTPEPSPTEPASEPASDIQKHDPPRSKAERGKNGITLSPQPSASSSAKKKGR